MTSRSDNTPPDPRIPDLRIPDLRDGLTRLERIVLHELKALADERAGRHVSSAELYGRVAQRIALSVREFKAVLTRLTGR